MNTLRGFSGVLVLLVVAVVLGGGFYLYHRNNATVTNQENESLQTDTSPFSVTNINITPETLRVGDDFKVSWKINGGETLNENQVILSFGIVDGSGKIIVSHLPGAGVGKTFRDEKWSLSVPTFCSTLSTEYCIEDASFVPGSQYRLKAIGWVCSDKERNPWYCDEDQKKEIEPAYSDWITISS